MTSEPGGRQRANPALAPGGASEPPSRPQHLGQRAATAWLPASPRPGWAVCLGAGRVRKWSPGFVCPRGQLPGRCPLRASPGLAPFIPCHCTHPAEGVTRVRAQPQTCCSPSLSATGGRGADGHPAPAAHPPDAALPAALWTQLRSLCLGAAAAPPVPVVLRGFVPPGPPVASGGVWGWRCLLPPRHFSFWFAFWLQRGWSVQSVLSAPVPSATRMLVSQSNSEPRARPPCPLGVSWEAASWPPGMPALGGGARCRPTSAPACPLRGATSRNPQSNAQMAAARTGTEVTMNRGQLSPVPGSGLLRGTDAACLGSGDL